MASSPIHATFASSICVCLFHEIAISVRNTIETDTPAKALYVVHALLVCTNETREQKERSRKSVYKKGAAETHLAPRS